MAEVLKTNDDLLRVMERYKVAMATRNAIDENGVAVSTVQLYSLVTMVIDHRKQQHHQIQPINKQYYRTRPP